jgi:hypothetical protein
MGTDDGRHGGKCTLIVEFTGWREDPLLDAVVNSLHRLRLSLMTAGDDLRVIDGIEAGDGQRGTRRWRAPSSAAWSCR